MGKKRKRAKQGVAAPAPAPAAASSSSAHPASGSDDDSADDGPPAVADVETAIYVVRYLAARPELFMVCIGLRAALSQ